jgi:hypothetical protein
MKEKITFYWSPGQNFITYRMFEFNSITVKTKDKAINYIVLKEKTFRICLNQLIA